MPDAGRRRLHLVDQQHEQQQQQQQQQHAAASDEHTLQQPLLEPSSRATDVDVEQPPAYDDRLRQVASSSSGSPAAADGNTTSSVSTEPHANNNNNNNLLRQRGGTAHPTETQQRGATRILDRDAAFFQSRGRWSVRHVSRGETRLVHPPTTTTASSQPAPPPRRQTLTKRFWDDWFHVLAYQKTLVLVFILFFLYALIIVVFAFIYLFVSLGGATTKVDPDDGSKETQLFCDMDIHSITESLAFSLSTMTTIGYGVSDYYFGGCMTPLVLVLMQVCCALIFDAVAIGLIFQRISRGHKRSKTVLFSDTATIRRVRGVPHLYIRLAELRHHQLLEAKVRAYVIRHERLYAAADATGVVVDPENITAAAAGSGSTASNAAVVETTHFVTKPMKLVHEDLGCDSHIMMSLPQVIVHKLDHKSPLFSPQGWLDDIGREHEGIAQDAFYFDNINNNNNETPEEKTHRFLREMKEIKGFLHDREVEIVILLEGTDELTGASIQARHSYTWDELVWNERFAPCTYTFSDYLAADHDTTRSQRNLLRLRRARRRDPPSCVVDFSRFHETVPAPLDTESCPYAGI